ncbi:ADP-ribosylglycohydrolase family protein [Photobacterium sanguinicancri]|uniref:ADP-ribosylglycohydrolase family protein n=1 Tax=Photobacterium sanguinicancri TaxID=875932 RepID=UPI0021C45628|nr:ADP-ribosylglycohydrolase family protein [Photobacterium sanguinicancri]
MSKRNAFFSRAQGCLLGLAIGDALGTTLEFKAKGSFDPITDMVGGGPFVLEAGQWTDDTSMALCLADSLLECGEHDPQDQLERYIRWRDFGYNSCTGECFDIGLTVSHALTNFEVNGKPNAGSTAPRSAGNGSIMRLAPIVIFYSHIKGYSLQETINYAALSSLPTHGEQRAVEACRMLAQLLSQLFVGEGSKQEFLNQLLESFPVCNTQTKEVNELRHAIAVATQSTTTRQDIFGRGYVVDSLQAAIWCFVQSNTFKEGALLAANLGDDADTTGAVYGQIAGAYYGAEAIPNEWLDKLYWREKIAETATVLAFTSNTQITEPSTTYFKLKQPELISALDDLEYSEVEQQKRIHQCPILDCRINQTRESLLQHICAYIRYTFGMPDLQITESSSFCDLEKIYLAHVDSVEVDDVTYMHIFCNSEGDGGMSDQGFVNYFVLTQDLPETLGIDGSSSPIDGYQFTLNNFDMKWETVSDLLDDLSAIIYAYQSNKSSQN